MLGISNRRENGLKWAFISIEFRKNTYFNCGNQGKSIAVKLKRKGILYFNALFKDTDVEFLKFYEIAIDEFHNAMQQMVSF